MRRLYPEFVTGPGAVGLLVVRLVAGIAMMLHGWPKVQHLTSWMPKEAPIPGPLQAAAALSEFLGGLAWALGLLTPIASFFLACTMAFAVFAVHVGQGHPFVASKPGAPSAEAAAGYLAIAVLLMLAGPGRLSIDAGLFGGRRGGPTAAVRHEPAA